LLWVLAAQPTLCKAIEAMILFLQQSPQLAVAVAAVARAVQAALAALVVETASAAKQAPQTRVVQVALVRTLVFILLAVVAGRAQSVLMAHLVVLVEAAVRAWPCLFLARLLLMLVAVLAMVKQEAALAEAAVAVTFQLLEQSTLVVVAVARMRQKAQVLVVRAS
jgi:hypothetical protein